MDETWLEASDGDGPAVLSGEDSVKLEPTALMMASTPSQTMPILESGKNPHLQTDVIPSKQRVLLELGRQRRDGG